MTVDVVVFVVSRHTYQNAALVDVVQQAVGRGRPWVVVYNEAPEIETVRAHLDKLAADVGAPPFARYRSPHDPEVEAGRRWLSIEPLDGGPGLAELLGDPARGAALRTAARAAALRDAAAELRTLATDVTEPGQRAGPAPGSHPARAGRGGRPGRCCAPCPPTCWWRRSATSWTPAAPCTGGSAVPSVGSPRCSAPWVESSGPPSARRGPRRWRTPRRRPPTPRSATASGSCSRRWGPSSRRGAATRPPARRWPRRSVSRRCRPSSPLARWSRTPRCARTGPSCSRAAGSWCERTFPAGSRRAPSRRWRRWSTRCRRAPRRRSPWPPAASGTTRWCGSARCSPPPCWSASWICWGRASAGRWCAPGRRSTGARSGGRSRRRLFGPLLARLDAQVAAAERAAAIFSTAAEQLEGGEA